MTAGLETRPVRGRAAKQERSERARAAIAEGVITTLAEHGAAGLTHRRAAKASGTSLAATTYYFATKTDMVAEASNALLQRYLEVFGKVAVQSAGEGAAAYVAFVSRVAAEGLGRDRTHMLAWYEMMLDGARDPEARDVARSWYVQFDQMWRRLADAFSLPQAEAAARSGVDLTVGAMVHGLGLGWTPDQFTGAVMGALSADALLGRTVEADRHPPSTGGTRKAAQTRDRLREAAIQLLAEGGASAVTYGAVASRAGLTPAAPVYHFGSVADLLADAQRSLFEGQKARYREVMGKAFPGLTLDMLVELTGVVFQREATEYRGLNVAGYAIWLEAARRPEVRPHVRPVMSDFYLAWRRLLNTQGVEGGGAFEAMCVQFLFVGAQIRVLAGGGGAGELAQAETRLMNDITALAQGRHWLQATAEFSR